MPATKTRGYQLTSERPDLWFAHCGHPKHGAHFSNSRDGVENSIRYHMKVQHPPAGWGQDEDSHTHITR